MQIYYNDNVLIDYPVWSICNICDTYLFVSFDFVGDNILNGFPRIWVWKFSMGHLPDMIDQLVS